MRVMFKRDRLWTPREDRRLTIKFRAGMEVTIKRAWGEQVVADGDAEEVDAPGRATDEPGSSRASKRTLAAAKIKALDGDGDGDGRAGGPPPKPGIGEG